MSSNVLPKSSLAKWSIGFVAVIILIYILIPVMEYRVGIAEPGSVTRIILASVLATSGIGSIATGIIGIKRKRLIFLVPLVLGFFALIWAAGFGFNIG